RKVAPTSMEYNRTPKLRIGDWSLDPAASEISRDSTSTRLETRTLRLLLTLATRAPEVVSIDDLLNEIWLGVAVSPDSVYQAVASLRRILGDDPKQPIYIATVPRVGYRMIATVSPWVDEPALQIAQIPPVASPLPAEIEAVYDAPPNALSLGLARKTLW